MNLKRTKAQLDFDYTRGWAFCNDEMLRGKVDRLKEVVKHLDPKDPRHATLRVMEKPK